MFVGRKNELEQLANLYKQKVASFVVLQGRRRIGKSRLVQEFAQHQRLITFTGLPPETHVGAQTQRDEFCRQLGVQLGLPGLKSYDWGDIFTLLSRQTATGHVIILLDEISWMGSKDPTFLGKLKNAWDLEFSRNPELMLIVCGSVSSWIEKNIISSTAFLGRPSLYMHLEELPLKDCIAFWGNLQERTSSYEKLKMLSVTGGVPRYLELLDPSSSAEDNIRRLCFRPNGPLVNEFDRIFSDIFGTRSTIYKAIIERLSQGSASQMELLSFCGKTKSGDMSTYLSDLLLAGFISRDYTWHLKTGKVSKLSAYRLRDNYTRFYQKVILPNKSQIQSDFYAESLTGLSGWDTIMGLQFENLVLNNQKLIFQKLGIPLEQVVHANPYFQRATQKHRGCQIDLLIQTKYNNLYICEIKFSLSSIGPQIINSMKNKIANLSIPRSFSYRPVLIHVNGVSEEISKSDYFSKIINFDDLCRSSVIEREMRRH